MFSRTGRPPGWQSGSARAALLGLPPAGPAGRQKRRSEAEVTFGGASASVPCGFCSLLKKCVRIYIGPTKADTALQSPHGDLPIKLHRPLCRLLKSLKLAGASRSPQQPSKGPSRALERSLWASYKLPNAFVVFECLGPRLQANLLCGTRMTL